MALAHPRVSLALWSWFGAAGVVTLTMTAASAQTLETPEAVGASSATELSRRLTAIAPAGQSLDAPPDRWLFEQPAKPPAIVKSAGDDGVATWADAPVTDADATAVGAIAQTPATNAEASEDIAVTDAAAVESIANAEAIAASLAVAPSAEATASAETDADTTAAATRADASDTAQAPTTEAPSRVQGRVSLGYTTSGGGYDGFGRLEFFAPLYQNPTRNVAFAEGKLLIDNDVNFGGNLRVGYRQVINDGGRTVGGYVGFDQRSSGRNDFSQVGVGLETVGETWEVRANGYVPVGETRELIADGIVNPRFATNRLLYDVAQVYEAAIGGFDLEAGGRLLRWDEFGSLYGYVGPYFLTGEGIDDTWGIRSRVELEISDGVRFGAGIQHDDLFGTNGVFSITASAPRGANRPNRDEPDAEELALANLGQPVYRNDAILIDTQFETPLVGQVAINPVTGQPYTFIHVQSGGSGGGTFEAPFGFGQFATATSQAGTDGNFVVYANENQDTNIGNFTVPSNVQVLSTGPVQLLSVLDRGQAVAVQLPGSGLGTPFFPNITGTATLSTGSRLSGFDFTPSGGNSPTISFIGTAGTTPVIPIAPTPILCVPQTQGLTQVQNVNLNSSQANTAAIEVSGFSNVVICDSNIAMTGDSGVGIRVVNDGAATLLNNTVTTAGSTAPGIVAELEGQVTLLNNTVTTTGRLSPGVSASQDGQVTLDSNTILTTGLESPGVLASNDGQVTLANNAITTTNSNSPGVQADSDSAVTIASCQSITTSGRRSHGVLAINNGSVNIENCTITTNGERANGIRLERNRDITIANNTVTTNGLFSRAITLNNVGGNVGDTVSIANNTVTTNGRISAAINLGDVGGTVSITNNTLQTTSGVNANGISVIQNLGTIDSLTISGNTIAVENNGTATDRVLGIILATDNTGRINNTTVADNTISVTGLSAGLEFNVRGLSTGFTGTTTVTGNTITGDTSGFNSGIVFDIAPNAFLGNGPFTVSNNQISTFDSAITSGSSRAGSFSNFSLLNNRLATLAASENVVDFRVDNGSFCFSQFSGNTATAGRFGFALARISGGTGIIQVIEPSTADDTLPTVRASNTGIGNTTGSFNFEAGVTDAVLACP